MIARQRAQRNRLGRPPNAFSASAIEIIIVIGLNGDHEKPAFSENRQLRYD
jgi:hypothetical protein